MLQSITQIVVRDCKDDDANQREMVAVAETGDRLATIGMGRKFRGGCALFLGGGTGSPCNTMWPGSRSLSVASGIVINLAIWPHGPKIGGAVPLFGEGELGPHLTQCRLGQCLPLYQVAS